MAMELLRLSEEQIQTELYNYQRHNGGRGVAQGNDCAQQRTWPALGSN